MKLHIREWMVHHILARMGTTEYSKVYWSKGQPKVTMDGHIKQLYNNETNTPPQKANKQNTVEDTGDVVEEVLILEASLLADFIHCLQKQRLALWPIMLQEHNHMTQSQVISDVCEGPQLDKQEPRDKIRQAEKDIYCKIPVPKIIPSLCACIPWNRPASTEDSMAELICLCMAGALGHFLATGQRKRLCRGSHSANHEDEQPSNRQCYTNTLHKIYLKKSTRS